jgi:hypothetical protein
VLSKIRGLQFCGGRDEYEVRAELLAGSQEGIAAKGTELPSALPDAAGTPRFSMVYGFPPS